MLMLFQLTKSDFGIVGAHRLASLCNVRDVTLAVDELNHDTRWSVLREQGHNFTFMWRDTESRMDKGLHEFVDLWASSLECSLTCNVTDSCADVENCQIDAFIGKYCTHVAACS